MSSIALAPARATATPSPWLPIDTDRLAATAVEMIVAESEARTSTAPVATTVALAGRSAEIVFVIVFFVTAAPSATPTVRLPFEFVIATATPTAVAVIDPVCEALTLTEPAVTVADEIVADTEFVMSLTATDAPAATPTLICAFVNASTTPTAVAVMCDESVADTVTAPLVVTGAPVIVAATVFEIELTATEPFPVKETPELWPLLSDPPTPTTVAVMDDDDVAFTLTPAAAFTDEPVIVAVTVSPTVLMPIPPVPAAPALASLLFETVIETATMAAVIAAPSVASTWIAPLETTGLFRTSAVTVL
jgi:hypothetical protein